MLARLPITLSSFSCLFVFFVANSCQAHPVPRDNHDRTVIVHLTPEAVIVHYRLELDEYRAVLDLPRSALKGVESRQDFHVAFRRHFAPILADNLVVLLDGKELRLRVLDQRSEVLDHVRCDYRFVARWKLSPERSHRFTFREGNYPLDSFSVLNVTLTGSPLLTLRDVTAPDEQLRERPADQRRPGDEERLRKLSATVLAEPSFKPGPVRPALPPELDSVRPAPLGRARRHAAALAPAAQEPSVELWTTPPAAEPNEEKARGKEQGYLHGLLNTKRGLLMLLVLAAAFGAAHALTPGHGKTLVAAYLVGRRGTVWHALVLGLTTTMTHTGSVLVLACLLAWFRIGGNIATVLLEFIGGLIITGMGLWLLMQRLTGRADHVHLGTEHSGAEGKLPGATWWSTVVLGVVGGLVPCWDAIALLVCAFAWQLQWLGVGLLLAFSAGLASVLVALGLLVVGAGAGVRRLWKDNQRFDRMLHFLPIVSAVSIVVIGLLMTFSSVRSGTQDRPPAWRPPDQLSSRSGSRMSVFSPDLKARTSFSISSTGYSASSIFSTR
jgi:ABC-type nickel/cobalt efflux system permease component RcnA